MNANPELNAEAETMIRELSHRMSDGIEVSLRWNSDTNLRPR